MKTRNKHLALLTALLCTVTAAGCAATPSTDEPLNSTAESVSAGAGDTGSADTALTGDLTKSDGSDEWGSDAVLLQCEGSTVTPSQTAGVTVENGTVTIRKGGDYVLSGSLDGRVIVSLEDKKEKVHLIFNGIRISCSTSAPLTVLQADKTVITLAEGTENSLTDAADYTVFDIEEADGSTYPNACLASKDDLTINGSGALTVSGSWNNGIHCADDLKIVSGTVSVTAVNHGIRGNDSVSVFGGTVTVEAGGDGIKSTTEDKADKGFVYVEGGTVSVTAQQDGIDAATALTVAGGTLSITAGGGAANAAPHQEDMPGGFGGMGGGFGGRRDWFAGGNDDFAVQPTANYQLTAAAADTSDTSVKGIKSDGLLTISGGTVSIDAADDGVHSDSAVVISGAVLSIAAGDDGIHADESVDITGGEIGISQSYEGIEAAKINIAGGTVHVKASDDGLNASDGSGGGMGFNRNSSGELNISGGYLCVDAEGDGLDSNGNITMTGGTVIVCGPTGNGDGALDSGDNNNTITVTGGTLIALGSTGMMETPEENYIASVNLNAPAGTLIVATDADGTVLCAFETPKQAQGIVFSANGMSDGYCIYTGGDYSGALNADGFAVGGSYSGGTLIASGSGGGAAGGFGGMQGGGFGGGRGGNRGFGGGDMTPPDLPDGDLTPPQMPGGEMTPPGGFGNAPF